MRKQILKLGTHRNHRRVWLDNAKLLEESGFKAGALYFAVYKFEAPNITLKLSPEDGNRKVSKKTAKGVDVPVIDLNSSKVGLALGNVDKYEVKYLKGKIEIIGA